MATGVVNAESLFGNDFLSGIVGDIDVAAMAADSVPIEWPTVNTPLMYAVDDAGQIVVVLAFRSGSARVTAVEVRLDSAKQPVALGSLRDSSIISRLDERHAKLLAPLVEAALETPLMQQLCSGMGGGDGARRYAIALLPAAFELAGESPEQRPVRTVLSTRQGPGQRGTGLI